MRLLHFESDKLVLTNFTGKPIPAYAILSHRWTAEEVLFDNVKRGDFKEDSAGWRKIKFCAEKAATDGLKYFWCDTCCINKWDPAELARSVNSMFKYYRQAAKCYVYLQDAPATTNDPAVPPSAASVEDGFRKNEWFKRGWTLQELVAPSSVEFFDEQGQRLGDRTSHRQTIHEITGIPLDALDGDLDQFSRENRLKWAEGRVTTEPEDGAYCLLGILGVQMPLTYGEGRDKAFARLHRELEADTKTPCLIPFSRKDYTIGHTSLLRQLEDKLFGIHKAHFLTIVGEGGLGKSHLALEFAYTARESRPDCSVFWCDASNADSLHQSYSDVAQKLRIASDQDQPDDVRSKLHQYLDSRDAGEWLLIYDNVVDASTMSATLGIHTSESLIQGLPKSATGSVLLTTRDSTVASAVSSESVRVTELDAEASAAMLQSYLADLSEAGDQCMAIAQLTRILQRPLAIVITAAYIRTKGIAVSEYIAQFENWARTVQADSSTASVNVAPVELASAEQSTNDVIRFTLNQIINTDLSVAYCIFELACLHETDIPLSFIHTIIKDKTHSVLATLDSYALITRRPALSAIDIHSLVHLAMRQELNNLENRSECVLWVISELRDTFPKVNQDSSRSQWRRLLPHARELFIVAHDQEQPALLGLKEQCGRALYYDGRYREAEQLQAEVLESARLLKMDDASIFVLELNFATTVGQLGRLEEAEQLHAQRLKKSDKDPENDNQVGRLTNINNLAMTYSSQGRWKEAEALQLKAIEESKAALGAHHRLTLSIMGNLGMEFCKQGRWQEATDLQLQVCEAMTRALGSEHPDTLMVQSFLGASYHSLGRLKEAEAVLTQVLETSRQVLSDTHVRTIGYANQLSKIYMDQGRPQEAGVILSKLLDTAKTVLGLDHPSVLMYRNNLAVTYLHRGRFPEVEDLQRNDLQVAKTVIGPNQPETIIIMNTLASAIGEQGRRVEARGLQEEVLRLLTTINGPRHPDTLSAMWNLALTYRGLRRWGQAEKLLLEVFRSRKAVLEREHPRMLEARNGLAATLRGYIVRFNPFTDWRMFRFALVVRASSLHREMSR
ncbi:FxSxx-COOH system tetratricopeptide repeat protein [Microdochium nivale]|nr:FxSxx-COOH system tetratricopeptide repeat protein [Microdochium nivale]